MKKMNNTPVILPVSRIRPFDGNPYRVIDNDEMAELIESIKNHGIMSPLIARHLENTDEYELISGHRRLYAAKTAGLETVPVFVYELDRDEAAIALVDSNLHREHILPSEKAFAYKLKMEAISHQGIACGQVGHKSREDVSDVDSGRTVQRYIRLTALIPELLDLMDEGKIAFSVGVELSYLTDIHQYAVLNECELNDCTPSYAQANRLHKMALVRTIDEDAISYVLSEEKANQKSSVKIPMERLKNSIPEGYNARQAEDFIVKAVEHYQRYLQRHRSHER